MKMAVSPGPLSVGIDRQFDWKRVDHIMNKYSNSSKFFAVATLVVSTLAVANVANAWQPYTGPWHHGYSHVGWCSPVALVVPPTAERQTNWGWGVGNTRITRILPQFSLDNPGPNSVSPSAFKPTPVPPTDTEQFGVYYVRGPW